MDTGTVAIVIAVIAAVPATLAAVLSYRARKIVDKVDVQLVTINDAVFELGKAVDGRLSALLAAVEAKSHAEGKAEGVAEERATGKEH